MILEQHQGGMLECLGQMWTWVCVESAAPDIVEGPYRWTALGFHDPGSVAIGTHTPGAVAGEAL